MNSSVSAEEDGVDVDLDLDLDLDVDLDLDLDLDMDGDLDLDAVNTFLPQEEADTRLLNLCSQGRERLPSVEVTLSHRRLRPPGDPSTLQPAPPNAASLLVPFSLRPSCGDLNLSPRLN
ncbi:unnamed protein product [Pleuronectes platessa]|uniref:Uncharacterized protein n=1 Tax=Pleuronectes platessa TaxID=8262 RepID=A0A9N7UCI6_PLEPL|nr:unnamed protein product [Pleuronectes platessa]